MLPEDKSRLLQDWKDRGEKGLYIMKPKASARGQGIRLIAAPDKEIKKGLCLFVNRSACVHSDVQASEKGQGTKLIAVPDKEFQTQIHAPTCARACVPCWMEGFSKRARVQADCCM